MNLNTIIDEREPEIWKDIPGYEGFYRISSLGAIESLPRVVFRKNGRMQTVKGRMLIPRLNGSEYPFVSLCKNGS
jgi:hypothetical protein